MKALTVDDSPTIRHIVAKTLKPLGFEIFQAGDGLEALKVIEEHGKMDLIVLDWNMPNMDGYEFLVEVRKREDLADMKIMMLTTENQRHFIIKAIMAGANEYLMKPFSSDMLIEKVKLLFDINN
ncbi:MAG TPA: response regulator [Bacteroidota bacterium]|jgi:two-component system chemotaxis response regulator CheY|nr:response regulator [Bacteroidota bacterium]